MNLLSRNNRKGDVYNNTNNLDGDGTTLSQLGGTVYGPIIPDS